MENPLKLKENSEK